MFWSVEGKLSNVLVVKLQCSCTCFLIQITATDYMGSNKILVLAPIKQELEINTVKSYYTQLYVYSIQLLKITH